MNTKHPSASPQAVAELVNQMSGKCDSNNYSKPASSSLYVCITHKYKYFSLEINRPLSMFNLNSHPISESKPLSLHVHSASLAATSSTDEALRKTAKLDEKRDRETITVCNGTGYVRKRAFDGILTYEA